MLENKIFLVAQREYCKNIRKPAFWLTTLALPTLIVVASLISGYSTQMAEKKAREELTQAKTILILDHSNIINKTDLTAPFVSTDNEQEAIASVRAGGVSAFFLYPPNIENGDPIIIHAQDPGIISRGSYTSSAQNLLKNNLSKKLGSTGRLLQADIPVKTTFYLDGEVEDLAIGDFVVPLASVVLYFFMTFLSSSFLLLSVSEEKENRMMEIVLSLLTPRAIIWGKIIGLAALALTQLVVLISLVVASYKVFSIAMPLGLDIGQISVEPTQILLSAFYATCGFLLMAIIMVGTGSAMPTYREAQSFMTVFIMLSIFPIYFATLIVSDPTGTLAIFTSYFPFTSPLILLARNALGALEPLEIILSLVVLPLYIAGGFYLAFKLFELGSLEYYERIRGLWNKS